MANNNDKKALNVPDKRVQNDACISSAERDEQVTEAQPKGNVPALRFPEFTGEWEKCRFGDIATGFDYGMNAAAKPYDGQNKYIRITDIDEASSTYNNEDVVSPDGTLSENYVVNERDILLARTGASTGKSYLYRKSDGKLYYAGFLIRANIAEHNPYFIFSQLHTHRYWRWVSIMSARSGQPGINSQEYASFPIYTTTLIEENKISTLLSLIDERIATQNKIIEKLETLIKGIVDSFFTANKYPKVPFKEIYVRAGEGGTPATSNPEYYDNGTIPFIKIDDLQNKYIKTNKDCITELGLQKSSAWIVPSNSIIYSNGATIGAISINLFPVCTKQGILGVVPKANINVEFLYYFMTSTVFAKAVERIVTEGTMRTAYLKDINHILCPIPCSAQQNEIAKFLSTLSAKLENEITFQRKLQKQKEFLLSQMFI